MPVKTVDGNMSACSLLNKGLNHDLKFFNFVFTVWLRILSIDRIASKVIHMSFTRQEVNKIKLSLQSISSVNPPIFHKASLAQPFGVCC